MTDNRPDKTEIIERLIRIETNLEKLRAEVAQILTCFEDEMESLREREYWREFGNQFKDE
jgi:hypothetical protein